MALGEGAMTGFGVMEGVRARAGGAGCGEEPAQEWSGRREGRWTQRFDLG